MGSFCDPIKYKVDEIYLLPRKNLLLFYSFKEYNILTFVRGVMYILLKYRAAAANQQIHVSVTRISCGWHPLCVKRKRIHIPQSKK